jgi:hypothetical protein
MRPTITVTLSGEVVFTQLLMVIDSLICFLSNEDFISEIGKLVRVKELTPPRKYIPSLAA